MLPLVGRLPSGFEKSPTLTRHHARLTRLGVTVDVDAAADYEEAVEMAARTEAALNLPGYDDAVFVGFTAPKTQPLAFDGSGRGHRGLPLRTLAALNHKARLRFQPNQDPLVDPEVAYWLSPAFLRHAGRWVEVLRNTDEGDAPAPWADKPSFNDAIRRISKTDPRAPLCHKFVGLGLKTYPVFFAPAAALLEEIGYSLLNNWNGGSLLQEQVEMRYEYRLLVVDWKIVGGSGTVPDLTADDRSKTGIRDNLDPRMNAIARASVEARPDILDRHRAFAEDALTDLKQDGVLAGTMTLDVFKHAGSERRGIVEMNPIGRAGWYAADPDRIVGAILTSVFGAKPSENLGLGIADQHDTMRP